MAPKENSKLPKDKDEDHQLRALDDPDGEAEYEYIVEPPDGGFGWVIVIAAMLCNLVCDGTLFAFGTMKAYLQAHFNCSDTIILMVGSIPCGVYLLVGPIVSGLANRYGCRIVIIIGSIGAAACMFISTLSPNVWFMMVIYGFFGGIFFGMVYLPSVVMVSFYFHEKRNIANGLVTAGTGIGALSFGPLADLVMKAYSWKVGMYVFGAFMLLGVPLGAIMVPLKPKRVKIEREPEEESTSGKEKDAFSPSSQIAPNTEKSQSATQGYESNRNSNPATVPNDIPNVSTLGTSSTSSPTRQNPRSRTQSAVSQLSSTLSHEHGRHGVLNPEDAARPLYQKDALLASSTRALDTLVNESLDKSSRYADSVKNIPRAVGEEKKKESAWNAFVNILIAMTDFSILKNRQMLLIYFGNIFSMLGYYLPIMCLIPFAKEDLGISSEQAPFLMTIFGFFNTIGRFIGGPIAMIPHLNALRVHNATLFISGIFTVLAAYANNSFKCFLYAGLCGFTLAPHMSLLPSVICECVGLDRYTTAFGILFLFRGVTSIIGPPAAGFIKDFTGRYDMAFAIGGAMIIIGAFFHIALCFVKPETQKNEYDPDTKAKKEINA